MFNDDMNFMDFDAFNKGFSEFWEMDENEFAFDENITLDDCEYYE